MDTNHDSSTTTSDATLHSTARQVAAFERRLPEMLALKDAELVPLNLDLIGAVMTVQGALPKLRSLRAAMASLAGTPLDRIDALEDYALATAQANSGWVTANAPATELPGLVERAVQVRAVLAAEAKVLAVRGLIDPVTARSFQSGVGFRDIAQDLGNLATLLRDRWGDVAGHTATKMSELDEATDLSSTILATLAVRDFAPQMVAATAKRRQQAFTLMVRAYDAARRAVTYLRWDERDADELAPSLYANRIGSRKKGDKDAAQPTSPADPALPKAGATSSDAEPAGSSTVPGVAPPAQPPNAIPPGFPGANPFLTK